MAGTDDDDTTDEFRWLSNEYDFVYKLTESSERLTETVFRGFFAHGPVDPEGRKRYEVLYTSAKFPGRLPETPEGRSIYTQRDPSFWYSDSEYGISCIFEFRHSLVRWTGPMVRPAAPNEDGEDVWEIDPQFKVEYLLEGIKLRHKTLLDYLRDVRLLPAEPPAPEPTAEPSPPEQPQSDSKGAEQSSPSEPPQSETQQEPPLSEPIHNGPTVSESSEQAADIKGSAARDPEWPSAEQLGLSKNARAQRAVLGKWPDLCRRYPKRYNADKVRAGEISGRRLAQDAGARPGAAIAFLKALRKWVEQPG